MVTCEWCEDECPHSDEEAAEQGWFFLLSDRGRFAFCGVSCMVAWL